MSLNYKKFISIYRWQTASLDDVEPPMESSNKEQSASSPESKSQSVRTVLNFSFFKK